MTNGNTTRHRLMEAARAAPPRPAGRPVIAQATRVLLAGLPMVVAFYGWEALYPAPASRPVAVTGWIAAGLVVLATLVTRLLRPPRPSMLPPPTGRLVAVAVGVPLLVAAWLLGWHATYDDPFTRFGLRCFALTAVAAAGPFAALARLLPPVVAGPRQAWALGAALGAAAGAWAAVVVELWCPLADPAHVAIGHVAPLLALAAAGGLLGARLLARRLV